jgi:hypothetical protein
MPSEIARNGGQEKSVGGAEGTKGKKVETFSISLTLKTRQSQDVCGITREREREAV